MNRGQNIVDAARRFLGAPFLHQGRTPNGIDCIGLLVVAARGAGIAIEDVTDYGPCPNARRFVARLASQLDRIGGQADALTLDPDPAPLDIAKLGDVLALTSEDSSRDCKRIPHHVAIKTDVGMIHTCLSSGRAVEHSMDDRTRARVHSAWRFR